MNDIQKGLLSFGLALLFGAIIFMLFAISRRLTRAIKKHKILSTNIILKPKEFNRYLTYQLQSLELFYLFVIQIQTSVLLDRCYKRSVVKEYYNKLLNELSIFLPYGGKIAEFNDRGTFILYYPSVEEDIIEIAETLKIISSQAFAVQDNNIQKSVNVGFLREDDYLDSDFKLKLMGSLVESSRNLGEITYSSRLSEETIKEHQDFVHDFKNIDLKLNLHKIEQPQAEHYREMYVVPVINNQDLASYFSQILAVDQPFVNMYLLETILMSLYENRIKSIINIPIYLNTLEKHNFLYVIQVLLATYQYVFEQTVISLKLSTVENEEEVQRNILKLINMNVKISMQIDTLDQGIYPLIQKYNVKRVELNDVLMGNEAISEMLYFCEVNKIEVVYFSDYDINPTDYKATHKGTYLRTVDVNLKSRKRGRN